MKQSWTITKKRKKRKAQKKKWEAEKASCEKSAMTL